MACKPDGAKGFVQKPYNIRQLLTTIREILDKNYRKNLHARRKQDERTAY